MAQKASLKTETGAVIPFMFNPTDLTIGKSATWNAPKTQGSSSPQLTYQGGLSGTASLSLMLDAVTTGTSVADAVAQLLTLVTVDPNLPASDTNRSSSRPPWVELQWGPLEVPFRAVVDKLQIKYTYFAQDGTPLRAKVDVSLKQYDNGASQLRQNPTSYTPRPHTTHRVLPGETLERVAALRYGDSTRWRLLADANGIDNPLRMSAGTILIVPELPVRHRG